MASSVLAVDHADRGSHLRGQDVGRGRRDADGRFQRPDRQAEIGANQAGASDEQGFARARLETRRAGLDLIPPLTQGGEREGALSVSGGVGDDAAVQQQAHARASNRRTQRIGDRAADRTGGLCRQGGRKESQDENRDENDREIPETGIGTEPCW